MTGVTCRYTNTGILKNCPLSTPFYIILPYAFCRRMNLKKRMGLPGFAPPAVMNIFEDSFQERVKILHRQKIIPINGDQVKTSLKHPPPINHRRA
jgi:hypothetical protein